MIVHGPPVTKLKRLALITFDHLLASFDHLLEVNESSPTLLEV